jgi:ubiquinone/menaquinone biosynthesis C-methylase UbiE
MIEKAHVKKKFWEEGGGFFGRPYMEGDDSIEGYLSTPLRLEERTQRELDGVIKLMELEPPQRILDCPCGYGRHSIGLAKRGFEVVGSDINGEMLEPAYKSANGVSGISFVKENMLHMNYKAEFDAAINLFFSIGFFETEEDNNQVLKNFFDALKPGGRFMMHTDINIPRIINGDYKLHEKRNLTSGKQLEIIESYEPENKRLKGQWILLHTDGKREELTPYNHRIYTMEDFSELCLATGFESVKGYGGWDGTPLAEDSEDMIIVAQKAR